MEHSSPFYSNSNTFQSQLITNPLDTSPYAHVNNSPNRHSHDQPASTQHYSQVISQNNGYTQRDDDQFRVDPFRETAVSTVIQTNSHRERPLSSLHVETNPLLAVGLVDIGKTSALSKPSEFLSPTHQSKILLSQKDNSKDEREEILSPEIFITRKKTDALLKSIILKYGLDSTDDGYKRQYNSNPTVTTDIQSQRHALSTVTNSYVNQQAGSTQNEDKTVYVSPLKADRTEENVGNVYRSPEEALKRAGNAGFHSNNPYRHSFDDHHHKIKGAFRGYSENKWQNRHSEAFQMHRYSHADVLKMSFSRLGDPSHREDKEVAFNKFYHEIMSTMSPMTSASVHSYATHKKTYHHMTEPAESKQDYGSTHHYDAHSKFVSPDNGEGLLKGHHKRAESGVITDIYTKPYPDIVYHYEKDEGVECNVREGHYSAEELNKHVSPPEKTYNHIAETTKAKPDYMGLGHDLSSAYYQDHNLYQNHYVNDVRMPTSDIYTSPYENHADLHEKAYNHVLEPVETKPGYIGTGYESNIGVSNALYHHEHNAISRFVSPDHRESLYRDYNIRPDSNVRTPNVDVFLSPYEKHVSIPEREKEVATSDFGRHVSPIGSYETYAYHHMPGMAETKPDYLKTGYEGAGVYSSTYHHDNNVYPGLTSYGHKEDLYHIHNTRPESNTLTGTGLHEGIGYSVREREFTKDDLHRHRVEEENRRVYRLPSEEHSREEFNYYEDDAIRQRRRNESPSPKKSSPIAHLKRELVTFGPESDREEAVKNEEKHMKSHHVEEKKEIKAIKVADKKKSNLLVYVVVFGLVMAILAWLGIILFYPEEESLY